jgi:hypothetical protein
MAQTTDPILRFGTRERRYVAIGHEQYPLRHPDDMSLAMALRYRRITPRFRSLADGSRQRPLTTAEEQEFADLLNQLIVMALDAPDAALARLGDGEKLAVVFVAFFGVPPAQLVAAAGASATTPAAASRAKTTRKRTSSRG